MVLTNRQIILPFIISIVVFSLQYSIPGYSQSVGLLIAKGKDANNKEEYNIAIYYLDQAILLDSNSMEAFNERGLSKYNLGRFNEALEDYEKAISINDSFPSPYFGIGSVKSMQKKYYEAIFYYTISIEKSLAIGDIEYAGTSYLIRGSTKGEIGDEQGKFEDYEAAAELGNQLAKDILKLYRNIK